MQEKTDSPPHPSDADDDDIDDNNADNGNSDEDVADDNSADNDTEKMLQFRRWTTTQTTTLQRR
jgi:hypothetical protein